jgi:hypothetical protein
MPPFLNGFPPLEGDAGRTSNWPMSSTCRILSGEGQGGAQSHSPERRAGHARSCRVTMTSCGGGWLRRFFFRVRAALIALDRLAR